MAYAAAKHYRHEALVCPSHLPRPVDTYVGDIRVGALAFDLGGHVEEGGRRFLGSLFDGCSAA